VSYVGTSSISFWQLVVRVLIFLGCLLPITTLYARKKPTRDWIRTRTPNEHTGRITLQKNFQKQNIVARDFLPPQPNLAARLQSAFATQDRISSLIQTPTPKQSYSAHIVGEYTLPKFLILGQTHLQYYDLGYHTYGKTADPEYMYPYLVFDTIPTPIAGMRGGASLGFLFRDQSWVLGLAADYRGEQRITSGDLPSRASVFDLRIREGLSIWFGEHWIGQWASFSRYWQWQAMHFRTGRGRLFRHLGFGLWNRERSIPRAQLDTRHILGEVRVGVQLAARSSGFVAEVAGTHRWGDHADNDYWVAAATGMQSLSLTGGYKLLWEDAHLEFLADLQLQTRAGVEHFYDSVGRPGNKRFQLLFSAPYYRQNGARYGASVAFEQEFSRLNLWGRLWFGMQDYKSKYTNPENRLQLRHWVFTTTFGSYYTWERYGLEVEFSCSGTTRPYHRHYMFSQHIQEPLRTVFLLEELARREALTLRLEGQLTLSYTFSRTLEIALNPFCVYSKRINIGDGMFIGVGLIFRHKKPY